MQHPAQQSLLGKQTGYSSSYDAGLLFPIARQSQWHKLGLEQGSLPFYGVDIWNAYELSWLQENGVPVVALASFRVPADSPNIIESKSFKLYLNSLNQSRFASWQQVSELLARDLSAVAGAGVQVTLSRLDRGEAMQIGNLPGTCLDNLDISIGQYDKPDAGLLKCDRQQLITESVHTHLLRSCCPVTGQPDWGSLCIEYTGAALCHDSLLAYVIGFREHQDFHEQCVERIFLDLYRLLQPEQLTVHARYLRRGGLDINPCRSTLKQEFANLRLVRQ